MIRTVGCLWPTCTNTSLRPSVSVLICLRIAPTRLIIRSTLVLHCYMAHTKIDKKRPNRPPPCKIVTPKISFRNFAHVTDSEITPYSIYSLYFSIGLVEVSLEIGRLKYNHFWLLRLSCSYWFLDPASKSNRWTTFTLYSSDDVISQKDGPFGFDDG